MSALTALTSGNKTLAESSEALTQRLEALESREPAAMIETGERERSPLERTEVRVTTSSKEKSLTLTFGEGECSSQNLRLWLFLEHFELAKKRNVRKGVDGWDDNEFRAAELRFQLRGV